jgi:serine/threonine protein kinase
MKYKVDQMIHTNRSDLQITEHLFSKTKTMGYFAKEIDTEREIFIKQYKSPKSRSPWYGDYILYQEEIRKRLEVSKMQRFIIPIYDFFEFIPEGKRYPSYNQAFVRLQPEEHRTLTSMLLEKKINWEHRKIFAMSLVSILGFLHEQNIIHCDLKPDNIVLFQNPQAKTSYKMWLIDMDFSILSDQQAPWHNDTNNGYVGTFDYMSPEHILGKTPVKKSDIFTLSLILYEILTNTHPYRNKDINALLSHAADYPELLGVYENGKAEEIRKVLQAGLDPNPKYRPDLDIFRDCLRETFVLSEEKPHIHLQYPNGVVQKVESGTALRRIFLEEQLGGESKYWNEQLQVLLLYKLDRWLVVPNPKTKNLTCINQNPIYKPTSIQHGDRICLRSRGTDRRTQDIKILFHRK